MMMMYLIVLITHQFGYKYVHLSATTLMLYPPTPMTEKEYLNIKQQFNNNNNNNNSSGNNSSKQQDTQQQTSYAVEMDINPHGGDDDYFFGGGYGDDDDDNTGMTSGGGNVVNFDDDDDFRDDDDDNTATTRPSTTTNNKIIEDDDPFASDNDDDTNNITNNTTTLPPNHSQCPTCRDAIPNLQYNRHVTFCANRYTVCGECNDKRYLKSTNHAHCETCHCVTTEFYIEQHNLAYHRKIICECLHIHREEHVAKYGMGNPDHPFNPAPYIHTFQTIKEQ
eukprot:UN02928